ncbi:hypothetical protein C8T65DRAFT_773709 [Cerioporus squamosus]|nr:hypothetical protein C8T65DRAFT_773709 [Cerioporus squamosus]
MSICTTKPDSLPALETLGLTERVDPHRAWRGRRSSSAVMPPFPAAASTPRASSVDEPIVKPFTMGQSSITKSSEERLAESSSPVSISGEPACTPVGRPSANMVALAERMSNYSRGGRTQAQWSSWIRKEDSSTDAGLLSPCSSPGQSVQSPLAILEAVPSRSLPADLLLLTASADKNNGPLHHKNPRDSTVRALLDELVTGQFDSASDQIIAYVNRSEHETDGGTLSAVTELVYELATETQTSCATYARLCKKLMERIHPSVHDESMRDAQGKSIAGGQLFRKCLLRRCREDFVGAWDPNTRNPDVVAEGGIRETREDGDRCHESPGHTTQQAGRHNVNVVAFMCELFKLSMLTDRIMHNSIDITHQGGEPGGH